MVVCYVCNKFTEKEHDCPEAAKLIANPVIFDAPHIHSDAIPSRQGPSRHVT